MAQDLISFLASNPVAELVQEVSIPGRLADYTFKIKPISQKEYYDYQQRCTSIIGKDKGVKFNSGRFSELVILNHVVEPNFRSVEVLDQLKAKTPEEVLNKFFLGGELQELTGKISEISGFNTSDEELEEEVKNS